MENVQQLLQFGWQVHQQQKDYAQAEQLYRRALASQPGSAAAWCYLGIALHDQRKYPEAVAVYEKAIELQPGFPIALNNLGNSLRYVGDVDRADSCFQKAIDLKPDYLNAYKNRGTLHVWTGSLDLGLRYYEQALQLNPAEAELHRNLGVIYLLQGRFEEGWREYRWRWKVGDLHRPSNSIPVWQGQPLTGKSILLTAEQGLGDTIHFVRFAKVLQAQGANTLIYCQPALVALLQASAELGPVFPNSLPLDRSFDFQASLIDVADVLQVDASKIPAEQTYLRPTESLKAYWTQKLAPTEGKRRIGIAWQGNPDHQADAFRSLPLSAFEAIARLENVELFSFQCGFGSEQLSTWKGAVPIRTFGDELDKSSGAFMDTAAIMCSLDMFVTSDTSLAHLAGALGVPTSIALGFTPDWRWLLERSDTPWYPSVKLFRQPAVGEWGSVLEAIASAATFGRS